jgi:hypothetical protein
MCRDVNSSSGKPSKRGPTRRPRGSRSIPRLQTKRGGRSRGRRTGTSSTEARRAAIEGRPVGRRDSAGREARRRCAGQVERLVDLVQEQHLVVFNFLGYGQVQARFHPGEYVSTGHSKASPRPLRSRIATIASSVRPRGRPGRMPSRRAFSRPVNSGCRPASTDGSRSPSLLTSGGGRRAASRMKGRCG